MNEIVFLLEEPSAEAMLEGFLPKILPMEISCRFIVFEGKQDLEKQLVRRLRGYRVPGAQFVVLRDQDSADCKNVKNELVSKCKEANRFEALVRIACHELESWYLADLTAVEQGLKVTGISRLQKKRQFSFPDDYPSPKQKLKQIAKSYQEISGSRSIGPHLNPDNTRSRSFAIFVSGLRKMKFIKPQEKK